MHHEQREPETPTNDRITATAATEDAAHTIVEQWLELWNGDLAVVTQIVAPDSRVHAALFDGGDGSAVGGIDGMQALVSQLRSLLPDLVFAVQVGPIVDKDHIALRWTAQGHYAGGLPGASAPAGKTVSFEGADLLRIEAGRTEEYWMNADSLNLMTQLGFGA